MNKNQFKFKGKVWLSPGMSVWYLVSLPKKQSQDIMNFFQGLTRGFGSLRVNVTIGKSKWRTSIFPDKRVDAYILPIKKEIRKNENIKKDDIIEVTAKILV
ncbi:MAG: DUF1905 domain-containing protein [bacterium]|nr:DUF1905 domain-containing protein [bacterium]